MKPDYRSCPFCKEKDSIVYIRAYEPWHDEYLICEKCDSTYAVDMESKGDLRGVENEEPEIK